jgi:hypothetical protein
MAEEIKKRITDWFSSRGCTDLLVEETDKNHIVLHFNCNELTSFNADIAGWQHSGIELDSSDDTDFRIEFSRESK